jgi:hypothetical protein
MRLSLDGQLLAHHRSEGFAHPMKRWFSFLIPSTVWIDDVKIWKVKFNAPASRLKKSCRGVKRRRLRLDIITDGVRGWRLQMEALRAFWKG